MVNDYLKWDDSDVGSEQVYRSLFHYQLERAKEHGVVVDASNYKTVMTLDVFSINGEAVSEEDKALVLGKRYKKKDKVMDAVDAALNAEQGLRWELLNEVALGRR